MWVLRGAPAGLLPPAPDQRRDITSYPVKRNVGILGGPAAIAAARAARGALEAVLVGAEVTFHPHLAGEGMATGHTAPGLDIGLPAFEALGVIPSRAGGTQHAARHAGARAGDTLAEGLTLGVMAATVDKAVGLHRRRLRRRRAAARRSQYSATAGWRYHSTNTCSAQRFFRASFSRPYSLNFAACPLYPILRPSTRCPRSASAGRNSALSAGLSGNHALRPPDTACSPLNDRSP